MFKKFKEKLKIWTKKVSEEGSENVQEKEQLPKDIDERLKKELKKRKYMEVEKSFNVGMEAFVPDIEKSIKKMKEQIKVSEKRQSPEKTEKGEKERIVSKKVKKRKIS